MLIEVDGDREVRRIVICAVVLHLGTGVTVTREQLRREIEETFRKSRKP